MAVFAIGALALALRLYRLDGRSLWLDEVLTATASQSSRATEVVTWAQSDINGMPLFLLMTWLLARWGDSEVLLRLPSVLAGTLAVVAVYLLGRRLFGARAGLVSALLTALVPFSVWYSQEARAYALFMLLTTLQMLFALTAVKRGRWFDWLGLAAFTVLNLYTHYLALAPTAAITVYVGFFVAAGLLERARPRIRVGVAVAIALAGLAATLVHWRPVLKAASAAAVQHGGLAIAAGAVAVALLLGGGWLLLNRLGPDPVAVRRLRYALGSAFLGALAYAPWLPSLRVFLSRPDQSVLRYDLNHAASLGEALGVLAGLGVSGILLAGSLLGLAAVVLWSFRGRATESALLLCWLGVSLFLLWLALGGAIVRIEVRYFAFLFPAAMLLVGAAVEVASVGLESVLARRRMRISASVISAALVAGMLVQVLPALAASYGDAKSDYRTLATRIATTSPPGSVVLAIGDHPDYVVICMTYYLRRLHAPVAVLDGRLLNSDVATTLTSAGGVAWGVAVLPSAGQRALLAQPRETVTDFEDVSASLYAVRTATRGLSPADQVRTLLRWEMAQEPELGASLQLLDLLAGRTQVGSNLLPPASTGSWQLQAGATASFSAPVDPGAGYALTFECRNGTLDGSQTVSATLVDGAGRPVVTYLDSGAYRCPHASEWWRSAFSISVPRQAASVVVRLGVQGSGTAEFRNLAVGRMPA